MSRGLFKCIFLFGLPLITSPLFFFGKEFQFLWIYILYALFIMFEPIPLVATALLPLFLLPIFSITKASLASMAYFFDATPFVLACFILALAVEETGLHRRVALTMMRFAGSKKKNILISIILSTAFISMFITDLPVLTVVISIIYEISRTLMEARNKLTSSSSSSSSLSEPEVFEEKIDLSKLSKEDANFCKAMMFCGPVAAVCGGRLLLSSSVMNIIIKDVLTLFYPNLEYVPYPKWFLMSLPAVPLQLLVTFLVVTIWFLGPRELLCCRRQKDEEETEQGEMIKEVIREQYLRLDRVSFAEGSVMLFILFCVAAWFFRSPGFMPGWSVLLPENGSFVSDTTFSVLVCILLFIWPKSLKSEDGWTPILTLEAAKKLPFDVVLLIGSSFAITEGIKDSKFVDMMTCVMTHSLSATRPIFLQLLGMSITMFECGGANMIWTPIFIGIANQIRVHPFYFALPIVFTAGSQFVLPNSIMVLIVLQTKIIQFKDLIIPGGLIQLVFALITILQFNTWAYWLLDLQVVPEASLQLNCSQG